MMKLINVRTQVRWMMLSLILVATMDVASGNQLLIAAVKDQDTAAARELITQNVDVNSPQADGATALHWAVHRDDLETAKLLIGAGANVNVTNDFGVMPLSLAATNGNASMVETLLKAGADSNAILMTGETLLMTAAHAGDVDTVGVLLRHGADVNAKEPVREQTALMWAIGEKHTEVARILVEHGADIHAKTTLGFTPLLFAAREGDLETARLLLDRGVDVNTKVIKDEDSDAETTPSRRPSSKLSALHVAVQRGHGDIAALLLDRGADPNADGAGWTPLHWAVGTWETEMNGANGMTSPKDHEWDMLRGVQDGKFELVKALLDHGADPNVLLQKSPARYGFTASRPPKNSTPFYLAAFAGEADIMRLLADHGADPSLRPDNNLSPLMIAAGVNRSTRELSVSEDDLLAAMKVAVELGADVNETDRGGNTAMHGAAWIRSTNIVHFLVDNGADVNAKNKQGRTPLYIADHSGFVAGSGDPVLERLPVGHLLDELSVPAAVKKSLEEWSNIPRHVRDAVESLLQGELENIEDAKNAKDDGA